MQEIGEIYGRCRSTAWHHIHSALLMLRENRGNGYTKNDKLIFLGGEF